MPEHGLDRLDQFNARDLTATEVADKFVEPKIFEQLVVSNNSLLIGPRGSGKTTLLKMLTFEGVERSRIAQPHEMASPEFGSIYVPIDVQLSDRLESIENAGFDSFAAATMIRSLFGWHVYRCISQALKWHCPSSRRRSGTAVLTVNQESDTVKTLAELWGLSVDVPVVSSLRAAIRAQQARALEDYDSQALALRSGATLDLRSLRVTDLDLGLKGAVEILGELSDATSTARWAVLFDEVEVAPASLQQHLFSYLRHSDPSILFKVAISPYMQAVRGIADRSRGSALNDYGVIDLQALDDEDTYSFTEAYLAKAASLEELHFTSLQFLLGDSLLAVPPGAPEVSAYSPTSRQARRISRLPGKDPSFDKYLRDKGLVGDDLVADLGSDARAPFRKVRQVALVREEYIGGSQSKSTISQGQLYVGAAGIARLCEGNPRRLAFISTMLMGAQTELGRVPYAAQISAMVRTQAAFRSFLRGLPVSEELGQVLPRGSLSLIDLIGHYFHNSIMAPEFDDDPVGSFIVDANAPIEVDELLARAVNSGAIVQLADDDEVRVQRTQASFDPISTSRGKRFRLSYVLSPGYGLLLRVGRANSLKWILSRSAESRSKRDRQTSRALLSGQEGLW